MLSLAGATALATMSYKDQELAAAQLGLKAAQAQATLQEEKITALTEALETSNAMLKTALAFAHSEIEYSLPLPGADLLGTEGTSQTITVEALAPDQGDPKKGEAVFKKCLSCHQVGEGASLSTGPVLNGIVGAAVGAVDGFGYSQGLAKLAAEGAVWDVASLDAYLEDPGKFAPGTNMNFAGLDRQNDRAHVIAYLASFAAVESTAPAGYPPEVEAILAIPGDAAYGEYMSSECKTCHQTSGANDGIPGIIGWEVPSFVATMSAYRTGARQHGVMNMIAQRLSDEEIAGLAVYFRDLK